MTLRLKPLAIREARRLIPVRPPSTREGGFAIGCCDDSRILAVVVVAHPRSRLLDDGSTYELSLSTHAPSLASSLIRAGTASAFAMGCRRVTVHVESECDGELYRAAGWHLVEKHRWQRTNPSCWGDGYEAQLNLGR